MKELVPPVEANITAARKHVGLVERKIKRVKIKKVRDTTSEFPFMWIPILVLIHTNTMYRCAFWLNAFPQRSENYGFLPREIVTGLSTDYERDCKIDPILYGTWKPVPMRPSRITT